LRPAAALTGGAAAGLAVPLLPFVALAPGAVIRDVLVSQEVRKAGGHGGPLGRLSDLAGLRLLPVHFHSGLALPLIAVVLAAGYAGAYLRAPRPRSSPRPVTSLVPGLDRYALASAVAVTVMFLWPRYYYSHYGAFDGPFLALAAALPAGLLRARLSARPVSGGTGSGRTSTAGTGAVSTRTERPVAGTRMRRVAGSALAGLVVAGAVTLQFRAESRLRGSLVPAAADQLIPPGACVLTNDTAYSVAAGRFYSVVPGCPQMMEIGRRVAGDEEPTGLPGRASAHRGAVGQVKQREFGAGGQALPVAVPGDGEGGRDHGTA
jgi:hypothetical protein